MIEATANPKLRIRQADHRFYLGAGIFMSILVVLGFWPTYFRPLLEGSYEGSVLLHVHALVFLTWMAAFLVQTLLVIRRRTPLHRKLGLQGIVLGAAMFVLGVVVASLLVRRLLDEGRASGIAEGLWFASEPYLDIVQFAILLGLGFSNRRNPPVHRRYMLLTTIAILPAATARMSYLIGPWSMEIAFFVMASLILFHDRRVHGKIHRANVIGLLILLPRALLAMSFKI